MHDIESIEEKAVSIRDVVQRIIEACQSGQDLDPLSRTKLVSGSLAQDAAKLGILIALHEESKETH